jgi:hypothetical protein
VLTLEEFVTEYSFLKTCSTKRRNLATKEKDCLAMILFQLATFLSSLIHGSTDDHERLIFVQLATFVDSSIDQ